MRLIHIYRGSSRGCLETMQCDGKVYRLLSGYKLETDSNYPLLSKCGLVDMAIYKTGKLLAFYDSHEFLVGVHLTLY